jgi:hypothetical protein
MVVLKVHFGKDIALEPESKPPIASYSDAVFAFPVPSKRMELPTRHSRHLGKIVGKLQGSQDRFNLPDSMRGHAAWVIIFIKASETFMPKLTESHGRSYGITVRGSMADVGV